MTAFSKHNLIIIQELIFSLLPGDQINKLLNEMWREIVNEVGPSICHSLSSAVVESLAVLLEQVSFDELMPDK